jgi:hypothetical protein
LEARSFPWITQFFGFNDNDLGQCLWAFSTLPEQSCARHMATTLRVTDSVGGLMLRD